MYLWVSILVCQVVYFILIIVARCLQENRDKTRQLKLDSNTMAEKCFILIGLHGRTLNHGDIEKKINAGLQRRKIEARVKSLHLGFTSDEVGLDKFYNRDTLLGFVRLAGADVERMWNIKMEDAMELLTPPEDILGRTEAKLQQHIADMIPEFKENVVNICKKLGIKICLEDHNMWLVGDSLQINIARNYLNQLFEKTPTDFSVSSTEASTKPEEMCNMIDHYEKAENDQCVENLSTAYLQLAFFLDELPSMPETKKIFIKPRANCYTADFIFLQEKSSGSYLLGNSVTKYKQKVKESLQHLETQYKPVYLVKKMPFYFRSILETVLEQMFKPTLYMKCKKRHWSCYIFPAKQAKEVQQFVHNYLKVNTYKSLDDWWSELPKEILTTREVQCTDSATKVSGTEKETPIKGDTSDGMGITGSKKEEGLPKSETSTCTIPASNGNKPRPADNKPKPLQSQKNYPLTVEHQNIQYLYFHQMKEIQEMETKHKVKLVAGDKGLCVMAPSETLAKNMEEELKLKSVDLHCSTVQDVFLPESTVRGVLILNCIDDTSVSVRGPKELVEAFEKALEEKNKKVDTNDLQMKTDGVKQPEKTSKPDDHERADREPSSSSVRKNHSAEGDKHKGSLIDNKTTVVPPSPTEDRPQVLELGKVASKPRVRGLKPESKSTAKSVDSKPASKAMPKIKGTGTEGMKTYESETTGVLVKVGKGDITKLQVDAIVNAANEDLDHVGGVARAIANAAGPGFDEECQEALQRRRKKLKTGDICVTGAGDMPANKVLHAVGPAIDDYKYESDAFDALKKTFDNCLMEAQNEMCEHVAIPAISSGNYGVPVDKVAKMAAKALADFLDSDNTDPLRMVIFIDIQQDMIRLLEKEMKKLVKSGKLKE